VRARPAKLAPSQLWALVAGCALAAGLLIAPNTSQAADGVTTNVPSAETLQGQDTAAAVAAIEAQATGGVKQVSAGSRSACATTGDGSVFCWGDNSFGQLGDGSSSGQLGDCSSGQPEDGEPASSVCPVRVRAGDQGTGEYFAGAVQVSTGRSHACAITQSQEAYCWGNQLRLGTGLADGFQDTPRKVSTATVSKDGVRPGSFPQGSITEISAGWKVTCARAGRNGGQAYCWGDLAMSGYPGQGLPWLVSNEGFPGEDFSNDNVSAVSAGGTHACLVQQGNAWCLGSNYTGQLGHGSVGNNAAPLAPVVAGPGDSSRLSGVTAINAGESQGGESNQRAHTCAITDEPPNAQTYCWGNNSSGQLGDGKFDAGGVGVPVKVNVPVVSSLPNGDVASVSAGVEHTCAVTQAGAAYCWGNGGAGALGTGKSGKVATPIPVAEPEGGVQGLSPTRQISAGADFTCAVGTSAGAFCFGLNNQGQLGIGIADGPEICQNGKPGEERACSLFPLAVSGQLRVFPSPVVLPDTTTGDATSADVRLRASFLTEPVDVKVDIPEGDKEGFKYSSLSGCATTGNIVTFTDVNCRGQIDFSPQKLGQHSATMRLTPVVYPYADAEFLISGLATGASSGPVVSGDPVDFGDVATFTAKDKKATITNIGNSPLRVTGVKITSDPDDEFAAPKSGNKCLNKNVRPGDSCTIAVQFFPRHPSTSVALLELQSNAQGKATIGLTGVGVATDSSGVSLGKVRKLNAPSKKTKSKRALVKWKRPKTQLPVTSYQTRTKKCTKKSAGGWNCKKLSWSKWRDKDPRPNANGWISRDYRKLTPQTRYKVQVRALSNDIRGKKSAIPVTTTKPGVPTRPGNG